jgi:hypothetical protein
MENRISTEQRTQEIWEAHGRGDFFPEKCRGKLNLPEAYRIQLGLLDRKKAGQSRSRSSSPSGQSYRSSRVYLDDT